MDTQEPSPTPPQADIETRKWEFDREARLRELARLDREQSNRDAEVELKRLAMQLQERDQGNRDAEVELKRAEHRAAAWRSPLTVAIFAAALAGLSNALVAVVNGSLQRDLENAKRNSELSLERSKSESTRILEMIKTGNTEKAADNLAFLLSAGLVTDANIKEKLAQYLAARAPGTGPILPSPTSRIGFDDSFPQNKDLQQKLEEQFVKYLTFLDSSGFPPATKKVLVQLDQTETNNTYYDGSNIVIDHRVADDTSIALREYTHHVLIRDLQSAPNTLQYSAIESGLADYFACSFVNSPKLGLRAAVIWKTGKPFIRNLDNNRSFKEFSKPGSVELHEGGEIWGGMFWDLRRQLGQAKVDKLLASSWLAFAPPATSNAQAVSFVKMLLEKAQGLSESDLLILRETLRARQFPAST